MAEIGKIFANEYSASLADLIEKEGYDRAKWWMERSNLKIDQNYAKEVSQQLDLDIYAQNVELQGYLNDVKALLGDYVFHMEQTRNLWYYDPTLHDQLSVAENEYKTLLQEARIQLYKLTRMMEYAWCENFSNPVMYYDTSVNGNTIDQGTSDEFTSICSIFDCANHEKIRHFYNALITWDSMLRSSMFRGGTSSEIEVHDISLKRDLLWNALGYNGYVYNKTNNQYDIDGNAMMLSSQFHAYLQRLVKADPINNDGKLRELRIEFPFNYGQSIVMGGNTNLIIPPSIHNIMLSDTNDVVEVDNNWNHRITEISVDIKSNSGDVFASKNMDDTVPVTLELFGLVERNGFFLESLNTGKSTSMFFDIPQYQYDSRKRFSKGGYLFGRNMIATLGASEGKFRYEKLQPEWPLFCSKVIFILPNKDGTLRIDNIDDIIFKLKIKTGAPDPITWPTLS